MAKIAGIYKITSPSGTVYIGQSWNIQKRWHRYVSCDNSSQPRLHNSFQKYGVKRHIFEVLHELPKDISQDTVNIYECFYINQYKSCGIKLLNVKEGGSAGKHSEESKSKMSKWQIGTKHSTDRIKKNSESQKGRPRRDKHKPIVQYSLKGDIIKEWDNLKLAADVLGIQVSSISQCINGKLKKAGKFIWRGKGVKYYFKESDIKRNNNHKKVIVLQLTLNGELIKEWESVKSASLYFNCKSGVQNCLSGQRKTYKGYIWKYK